MVALASKLDRLREAWALITGTVSGWTSKRELIAIYARLGAAAHDHSIVELRVRCGAQVMPCRIRRSDIFTLAEIFHERQYQISGTLPPAPVIVDAGANIGLASLWMSGAHPGAQIHAFEPEPANFSLLEQNLQSVYGAKLNPLALGDRDGEATLKVSEHGAMHAVTETALGDNALTVPVQRLDTYLEHHGIDSIDLLKLDVEGAELSVLHGLGDRIDQVRVITGEVHERVADVHAFYAYLAARGFAWVRRTAFRDGDAEGVHGFEARRGAA